MKRKIKVHLGNNRVDERVISYIPGRYILAFSITLFEVLAIIAVMIALCLYIPYFYIAVGITTFVVELKIISSNDNPDYKIPWMIFVLVIPVAGLMLYLIFGSRKLKKKFLKRLKQMKDLSYKIEDKKLFEDLENENPTAIKRDIDETICKSIAITPKMLKTNLFNKFFRALVRIFAPML